MLVREMTTADIDAVAALRVRAWRHAYAELLPRAFLDAMSVEDDAARRREGFARAAAMDDPPVTNIVTQDTEGTVTGWAALGPDRPEGAHTDPAPRATGDAELYAIYVLPELLGTGLGRTLLSSCLERAALRGFTRVLLWVVEGNRRARRFYERAGFAADGAESTYDLDGRGTHIPIVRYALPLPPPPQRPLTGSGSA